MVILSVDYGDVRTGIAVCDKFGMLASPVKVIVERDSGALADEITEIATEKKAEKIVLGLPKIHSFPRSEERLGKEYWGFRKIWTVQRAFVPRLVGNWQSLFQKGLIFR